MRWCCVGFQSHVEAAGRRGMSIILDTSDESDPRFVIQHRAVDHEAPAPEFSDVPVSLVTESRIAFCPWCGTMLKEFYQRIAGTQ